MKKVSCFSCDYYRDETGPYRPSFCGHMKQKYFYDKDERKELYCLYYWPKNDKLRDGKK